MSPKFRVVLCPTDFSADGDEALEVAYRLVAPGGTVHRLYVLEPDGEESGLAGEEAARRLLHAREGSAGTSARTKEHVIRASDVAGTIEHIARSHGAEVVVMSSRGRTGLSRLFLGSVASDLLRRTDLPLIIVRSAEAASAA